MSTPSSAIPTTPVMPRRSRYVASPHDSLPTHKPARDREVLESLLVEAADLVEVLRRGPRDPDTRQHTGMSAMQLIDFARTAGRRDGFGNHTPGFDPPEANPRPVLDSENNIIKYDDDDRSPVTDRTGEGAMSDIERQPAVLRRALQLAHDVEDALDNLRDAVNGLMRSQPDAVKVDAGEPCCKMHAKLGDFEPVTDLARNSELCTWCYRFLLRFKELPPLRVVELRIQGRRITTRVLKECGVRAA